MDRGATCPERGKPRCRGCEVRYRHGPMKRTVEIHLQVRPRANDHGLEAQRSGSTGEGVQNRRMEILSEHKLVLDQSNGKGLGG